MVKPSLTFLQRASEVPDEEGSRVVPKAAVQHILGSMGMDADLENMLKWQDSSCRPLPLHAPGQISYTSSAQSEARMAQGSKAQR